jgi:hypothetical protein
LLSSRFIMTFLWSYHDLPDIHRDIYAEEKCQIFGSSLILCKSLILCTTVGDCWLISKWGVSIGLSIQNHKLSPKFDTTHIHSMLCIDLFKISSDLIHAKSWPPFHECPVILDIFKSPNKSSRLKIWYYILTLRINDFVLSELSQYPVRKCNPVFQRYLRGQ